MITFHVVRAHEPVSSDNGSAILQIARELAIAGTELGDDCRIVSGFHPENDELALPLLYTTNGRSGPWDELRQRLVGLPPRELADGVCESEIEPDVIWLHNRPLEAARFRRVFPTARIVLVLHNRVMRWSTRFAMRRALSGFDAVVCVSHYVARDLSRRSGIAIDHFGVVHPTVPGQHRDPSESETSGAPIDVLFVGRVAREKGVVDLLKAMRHVPGARLTIVGGAWFRDLGRLSKYEQRARRLGDRLSTPATFTGPLPPAEVEELRNRALVTVVPSRWSEPFGLTVLEAMRSHSAVIATRAGGIPEIASLGGVLLVPRRRPRALASAIRGLLCDSQARLDNSVDGIEGTNFRTWTSVYAEMTQVSTRDRLR